MFMGEVALKYRLMPESPDSDIDAIIAAIPGILPKDANLGAHDIQPFAFGLKAIIIAIIGSGISGLTCAHILDKKHYVTIFEKFID